MSADNIKSALFDILHSVEHDSTYAVGGKAETLPLPGLQLSGIGPITLPLQPTQAAPIVAASEQAPCGKGSATVVDTSIRNCHQIDASHVSLSSYWQDAIFSLLRNFLPRLGVKARVRAELHKLVIYSEGGFFVPHKDTEKAPGMFATLVVQLPAAFEGGAFHVTHGSMHSVFDFTQHSAESFHFVLFFADCEHEIKPITSGNRLCLLYNLIRTDNGSLPNLHANQSSVLRLISLAADWDTLHEDEDDLSQMLIPLDHMYTKANFGFHLLKGRDAAVASVLRQCGKFGMGIGLFERHARGCVEYDSHSSSRYKRRRWDGWDDDEDSDDGGPHHMMSDIIDEDFSILGWKCDDRDGHPEVDIEHMNVGYERDCICDQLFPYQPDKEEYESYTGNAGPTVEHWYRTAALVIWPLQNSFYLSIDTDFPGAVRYVNALHQGGLEDISEKLSTLVFSACSRRTVEYDSLPTLLSMTCKLQNRSLAVKVLTLFASAKSSLQSMSHRDHSVYPRYKTMSPPRAGCASSAAVDALIYTLRTFGWAECEKALRSIVEATPVHSLLHCSTLVAQIEAFVASCTSAVAQVVHVDGIVPGSNSVVPKAGFMSVDTRENTKIEVVQVEATSTQKDTHVGTTITAQNSANVEVVQVEAKVTETEDAIVEKAFVETPILKTEDAKVEEVLGEEKVAKTEDAKVEEVLGEEKFTKTEGAKGDVHQLVIKVSQGKDAKVGAVESETAIRRSSDAKPNTELFKANITNHTNKFCHALPAKLPLDSSNKVKDGVGRSDTPIVSPDDRKTETVSVDAMGCGSNNPRDATDLQIPASDVDNENTTPESVGHTLLVKGHEAATVKNEGKSEPMQVVAVAVGDENLGKSAHVDTAIVDTATVRMTQIEAMGAGDSAVVEVMQVDDSMDASDKAGPVTAVVDLTAEDSQDIAIVATPIEDIHACPADTPVAVAKRLVHMAARHAAKMCDVRTASRSPAILTLGTRVDPKMIQRLRGHVNALPDTELAAAAVDAAQTRGVITEAVLQAFALRVLPKLQHVTGATECLQKVWHSLLTAEPRNERLLHILVEASSAGGGLRNVLIVLSEVRKVEKWRNDKFVRAAVQKHVQLLRSVQRPEQSWCFPCARLERHPVVTRFLRSGEQSMHYGGGGTFDGIRHARNFANKYFRYGCNGKYSARAEASGRGRDAYVVITKTDVLHQQRLAAYNEDQSNLEALLVWLGQVKD